MHSWISYNNQFWCSLKVAAHRITVLIVAVHGKVEVRCLWYQYNEYRVMTQSNIISYKQLRVSLVVLEFELTTFSLLTQSLNY